MDRGRSRIVRRDALAILFATLVGCSAGGSDVASSTEALAGGRVLAACAFPSVGQIDSSCTATLVGPRWILSAAHCPTGSRFRVGTAEAGIVRCERHPDFMSSGRVFDFMVCELDGAIDAPVVPLMTPCEAAELNMRAGETSRVLPEGRPVMVLGFGAPTSGTKRGGEMEVSSFIYSSPLVSFADPTDAVGSRPGDSGGPTFLRMDDGTWRQVGVHHEGGVGASVLDVFVPAALPWIETTTGLDTSPCHDGDRWAPTAACATLPSDLEGGSGTFPACSIASIPPTPTCTAMSAPDAAVLADAGLDAAMSTPPDAGSFDASAPADAATITTDGSPSTDASARQDTAARPDASGASAPAGDCSCRAPARPSSGHGLLLATVVLLGLAVRRRPRPRSE